MNADAIRTLHDYNYALHRKIWACIDHITDAQFVEEIDYSLGSIRNHMIHVISVDRRWIMGIREQAAVAHLKPADYPTKAAARAIWDEIETDILAYIQTLDDAQLERPVTLKVSRQAAPIVHPAWQILVHMVNHGTDHRAQVLPILHRFGAPTLEQDFMIYLWAR
ncbi:MAG: DinB family protein [Anaerolineae bacterium]|nr:DinB family protein [Anaerolineae bacterium]